MGRRAEVCSGADLRVSFHRESDLFLLKNAVHASWSGVASSLRLRRVYDIEGFAGEMGDAIGGCCRQKKRGTSFTPRVFH